jgi:hypothetical protein
MKKSPLNEISVMNMAISPRYAQKSQWINQQKILMSNGSSQNERNKILNKVLNIDKLLHHRDLPPIQNLKKLQHHLQ